MAGVTFRVSEAVLPFTGEPLTMCDTGPLVLVELPATGATTLTVTMQVPPGAIVPPLKLIDPLPGAGANVGAPQPVVVGAGAGATTIAPGATGNVSVNATPDCGRLTFGLVIVKVRVVGVPASTGF